MGISMKRLVVPLLLAGLVQLPFSATTWTGSVMNPAGAAHAQDDDDDDDDRPRPRRPGADDDDDDDDDDEDDRPRPRQPGANDDDDDDDAPRPRQPAAGGDNDDDDDDAAPRPRQPATGGDDDDDDDRPRPRQTEQGDDTVTSPQTPAPLVQPPAEVREPSQQPLPLQAPDEIVALDLGVDDLEVLLDQGFVVIEQIDLDEIGRVTHRLRVPAGLDLAAARDVVRALPSGGTADFNHFYRSEQEVEVASEASAAVAPRPCDGLHCPAFEQVGWPMDMPGSTTCTVDAIPVGIIDTGLNAEHETFADARLDLVRLSGDDLEPSRAIHGTAVAAILVGSRDSRSPGLIPRAPLHAVDVFHRDGGDERSDVFSLIRGLDHLGEKGVRVINLSLAGPANEVLEETVRRLVNESGIVIVAAAGNEGPRAPPVYPAAYDGVIAVTAVDIGNTIYRRAGQGTHVDIAAPGVEVWTAASISGARSKTGTSFATPFVTAAAAVLLEQEPLLSPAEVAEHLAANAADLGETGFDPVFGHGLLSMQGACAD